MNGVELSRLGMQRRILRKLSGQLTFFQKPLGSIIQEAFAKEVSSAVSGSGGEWSSLPAFSMTKNIIGKANIFTFYGPEHSELQTLLD